MQLTAKSLDLTHPYFVSIKDIVFPEEKKLIINPSEDDFRKTFSEANHLMIPFQTVILIEEITDTEKPKLMQFEFQSYNVKTNTCLIVFTKIPQSLTGQG